MEEVQTPYHKIDFWSNLLLSIQSSSLSETLNSSAVATSYHVKDIKSHIVCSLCGGAGYIERISLDVKSQTETEAEQEIDTRGSTEKKRQSLHFIIKKSVLKYLEEDVEVEFEEKDEDNLSSEENIIYEKDKNVNCNNIIISLCPRTATGRNKLRSYEVELSFYKIVSPLLYKWALSTPIFYHGERQYRQIEGQKVYIPTEGTGQQMKSSRLFQAGYELVLSDLRQVYPEEIKSLSLYYLQASKDLSTKSLLTNTTVFAFIEWLAKLHACFWGPQRASFTQICKNFNLQEQGGYWYLDCRYPELAMLEAKGKVDNEEQKNEVLKMDKTQVTSMKVKSNQNRHEEGTAKETEENLRIQNAAKAVDRRLKGLPFKDSAFTSSPSMWWKEDPFVTLMHGDVKVANAFFKYSDPTSSPITTSTSTSFEVQSQHNEEMVSSEEGGMNDKKNACCMFDFQYVGRGYPTNDLANLFRFGIDTKIICNSFTETRTESHDYRNNHDSQHHHNSLTPPEVILLRHYHHTLLQNIAQHSSEIPSITTNNSNSKIDVDESIYPFHVMVQHYELSIINYTRFYLGWSALSKKEKGTIRPPLDPSFRQRTLSFLSKIDGGLVLTEKEYNSKIDEVYPF